MTEGINVLSLFDGIACGRVALERAGIRVKNYYASEVDKYAIKVAKKNWPDIVHIGDVCGVRVSDLPFVPDLVIGGSPCQGFSFAGKQLAFTDPRSKLFFEYVRILNESKAINSDVRFLLENVRMKKEYLAVIAEMMGVEPILIDSALVSAQSRKRYYWCNWAVTQPEDRGLVLRDIIEDGVVDRDKSYCIDANYWKGGSAENYKRKARRQIVLSPSKIVNVNPSGRGMNGCVYSVDAKSPTVTTNKGECAKISTRQSESRMVVKCGQIVGRKTNPDTGKRDDYNSDIVAEQRLEVRSDEKGGCLSTVQKDNVLTDGISYRKLTPVECERLQTLPDNYTDGISNTQRYKCLGNGWNVETIAHIFRSMMDE